MQPLDQLAWLGSRELAATAALPRVPSQLLLFLPPLPQHELQQPLEILLTWRTLHNATVPARLKPG